MTVAVIVPLTENFADTDPDVESPQSSLTSFDAHHLGSRDFVAMPCHLRHINIALLVLQWTVSAAQSSQLLASTDVNGRSTN